jgi:hypothetical protein
MRASALLLPLLWSLGAGAGPIQAQEPPDTVVVPAPPPDTAQVPEALEDEAEPVPEVPDTLRLPPRAAWTPPPGAASGSRIWEGDDLLDTRALTLAELLDQVPGMVPARGGDYGSPVAVGGFGLGGDRIRVFRNGIEFLPLNGGTPDLARIGLATVGKVRVDRWPGEVRVFLQSRLPEDLRPFSLVEVGTGDLETNLFRGSFLHPSVGGGILEVGLDRMDTRGTQGRQPGSSTGAALRYTRLLGDRGSLGVDFRRGASDRDTLFQPTRVTRTDLGVEGRLQLSGGVVAAAHAVRQREEGEGLRDAEFPDPRREREQFGGSLEAVRGFASGAFHGRSIRGEGWPATVLDGVLAMADPRVGGVEASWTRESGDGDTASRLRLRGWTSPRAGFSLFGSMERGTAGGPPVPPLPFRAEPDEEGGEGVVVVPALPGVRLSERTALRAGGSFNWRGLHLWGAHLAIEPDSLLPLGLPWDAGLPSLPGERRTGWEAGGRVPIPFLTGLAVEGWTQQWSVAEDTGVWPWLPDRSYDARLAYHGIFFPTGNLEIHFDVGARGRDPMFVRRVGVEPDDTGLESVPFFQSWSARLQIRVVTVRAFILWENVTLRPANQDLPGRLLPQTRALYGVRWMLWN